MPGPSYTLVHSTDTVVDIGPTPNPAPVSTRSSAPSSSPSSHSTGSSAPSSVSGSTSTRSSGSMVVSVVGMSTITFQDVPSPLPGDDSSNDPQDNAANIASSGGSSTGDAHKRSNTAVIIGATIGSIAALVLIIGVFLVRRRQKRLQREAEEREAATNQFTPKENYAGRPWSIPSETNFVDEKRAMAIQPMGSPQQTHFSHRRDDSTSVPNSETTFSSTHGTSPRPPEHSSSSSPPPLTHQENIPGSTAHLHPRSTEALIAAAAPPNMSRDQINQLTANFVSLVRGRNPRDEEGYYEEEGS
ncbi:hypothetical protein FRC17_004168, partial [Serendipita sp. 399]